MESSVVVDGRSVPRKALGFSVEETREGARLIDGRIVGVIDGAGDKVGDGVDTTILFGIFTSVTFIRAITNLSFTAFKLLLVQF